MEIIEFFMKEYERLKKEREELLSKVKDVKPPLESKELGELYGALAKAQAEMPIAGLNSTNPYFKSKYADLGSIIKASRPYLTKNGLSITQQVYIKDNGQVVLKTKLGHSSGQYISSEIPITPAKSDIQSFGSHLTYLRRYSIASLCGIVASDEDDDGEIAMVEAREIKAKGLSNKYDPREQPYEYITKEQLEELEIELDGYDDILDEVLDKLKLRSLADMPKSKFLPSIKKIRQIKQAREGK